MDDFNSTLRHNSYTTNNPFLQKQASNPIHFSGNQADMPKGIANRNEDNAAWLFRLLDVKDEEKANKTSNFVTSPDSETTIFDLLA